MPRSLLSLLAFFLVFLPHAALLPQTTQAQLAGTYTVPGDYATLADVIDALNSEGVSGDVVFELAAGTYSLTEPLPAITLGRGDANGTAPGRTVTFTSATGNLADVTITLNAAGALFTLDGADDIRFTHLTLALQGADAGNVLRLTGDVHGIIVEDAHLEAEHASSRFFADGAYALVLGDDITGGDAGGEGSGLVVRRTQLTTGGSGVFVDGAPYAGVLVEASTFDTWTGVMLLHTVRPVLRGNTISTTNTGLYLQEGTGGTIRQNRVRSESGTFWPALYMVSQNAAAAAPTEIVNNFFSSDQVAVSDGTGGTVVIVGSSHVRFWHNSVANTGASGSRNRDARALQLGGNVHTTGVDVRNNVLSSNYGYAYDLDPLGPSFAGLVTDYNALSTRGPFLARTGSGGQRYETLAEWQAAVQALYGSNQAAHSINVLPEFADAGTGDLHTSSVFLDGAGTPLGVMVDIDGEARPMPSGTDPDIGADEVDLGGTGPASCPQTLTLSDFEVLAEREEFVELTNTGTETVSLRGCAIVFYDGATETSYFAADLLGTVEAGATWRLGTSSAPRVEQVFPDGTLQDGPDAIALYDAEAASFAAGTPLVFDDVLSAIVYVGNTVYGASKNGGAATAAERLLELGALAEGAVADVPGALVLEENYPNPFNPHTTIRYALPEAADVRLTIVDVLGREVRTLVAAPQEAGRYEVTWDGRDGSGQPVATGLYLYALRAGEHTASRPMLLTR